MQNILNPQLYNLIESHLEGGVIKVVNRMEEATYVEKYSVVTGNPIIEWSHRGESYIARCPFCADKSGHLYISYLYGTYNEHLRRDLYDLAKCFRRECLLEQSNKQKLTDILLSRFKQDAKPTFKLNKGYHNPEAGKLVPIEPPARLIPVSRLPSNHPALFYLKNREFDPDELWNDYKISYCTAPCKYNIIEGRLFIPIYMNAVLVGWQARKIQDTFNNTPKYFTSPGLPKRLVLYNFDVAKEQDHLIICEGPTDVWMTGKSSVALLGKTISEQQLKLIGKYCRGKPIIVLLDSNDPDADRAAKIIKQKIEAMIMRVVQVRLPEGLDPGMSPKKELLEYIKVCAEEEGIKIDCI